MSPWLREISELIFAGERAQAIMIAQSRADTGSLSAMVRLACFGEEAGFPAEFADAIVDQAEKEVLSTDSDGHWALYAAYELRLGSCRYDIKARRSLQHLEKYARLTKSPLAAYAVAVRYSQGDIGTNPDYKRGSTWMQLAAKLGHPQAKAWVARHARSDASQETQPK